MKDGNSGSRMPGEKSGVPEKRITRWPEAVQFCSQLTQYLSAQTQSLDEAGFCQLVCILCFQLFARLAF